MVLQLLPPQLFLLFAQLESFGEILIVLCVSEPLSPPLILLCFSLARFQSEFEFEVVLVVLSPVSMLLLRPRGFLMLGSEFLDTGYAGLPRLAVLSFCA